MGNTQAYVVPVQVSCAIDPSDPRANPISFSSTSPFFHSSDGQPQIMLPPSPIPYIIRLTLDPDDGSWSFHAVSFNDGQASSAVLTAMQGKTMPLSLFRGTGWSMQVHRFQPDQVDIEDRNREEGQRVTVSFQVTLQHGQNFFTSQDPQVINIKNGI
jgi:hypothetical protein